jgi:hypothetical protein
VLIANLSLNAENDIHLFFKWGNSEVVALGLTAKNHTQEA